MYSEKREKMKKKKVQFLVVTKFESQWKWKWTLEKKTLKFVLQLLSIFFDIIRKI